MSSISIRSQFQFVDLFDAAALAYADLTAIESPRQSLSYAQLHRWSVRMAQFIAAMGPNDRSANEHRQIRVAVAGMIDPIGWACVLGASRAGAWYVPINVNDAPIVIAAFLKVAGCDCIFFADRYEALAEELASMLPVGPRVISLAEVFASTADAQPSFAPIPCALDDIARIAPTGGTTGASKAVMMSHQTLISVTHAMCSVFDMAHRPVYVTPLPLTHATATFVMPILMNGGLIVQLDRPETGEILAAIERRRATHLYTPPTQLYRLLDHPDAERYDYSSLRHLFYGAAPTAVDRIKSARSLFGPVMSQFYGQVEAPQVVTLKTPREHDENPQARLKSCGRQSPVAMVAIRNNDGELLGAGETGEICVRGPLVMKGYLDNPVATAEVLKDGYLHTGDLGYMDEGGYVFIVDRAKDMIISGGFNVYCAEVEAALMEHPCVRECAVFGIPSADWGEAVQALVVLHDEKEISAVELIRECKIRIGSIKSPKAIEFMEEFPNTAVGKIDKKALKAPYWKDTERKI